MAANQHDEEWIFDMGALAQGMRDNGGEMGLGLPEHQCDIANAVVDMRRFGYTLETKHDAMGRLIRVRLLEQ